MHRNQFANRIYCRGDLISNSCMFFDAIGVAWSHICLQLQPLDHLWVKECIAPLSKNYYVNDDKKNILSLCNPLAAVKVNRLVWSMSKSTALTINSQMSSSMSSIESVSSHELPPRSRAYLSTLLGRTMSPTRLADLPRKVEDGIIYRMLRQKGATHEEAYNRQKLCTEGIKTRQVERVPSAGRSSTTKEGEKM